jgi:hypothetical protein
VDQITCRNRPVGSDLRHRKNPSQPSLEFLRRIPCGTPEARAERAQALISDRKTDVCHRCNVADQQLFGAIDPHPRQEIERSLAKSLCEQPMVVKRRKVRLTGRIGKAQRLIQVRRNVISGAAEPAKEIVIDYRPKAVRRCVDQRMLHENIVSTSRERAQESFTRSLARIDMTVL